MSEVPKFQKKGRDDSFTLDGSMPTPSPSQEEMGVGHKNYLKLDG
ncbi:MAG: hypothetical protein O4806_00930 [Trichodesmium sp. St5_bin8]|nr:hypothetical protein [Trichodesmium sp. St5_bin8]MDT9338512.1 hypothetical protein [Trichodesmium erythraeum 21-75]